MVLTLPPQVEHELASQAKKQGLAPEDLAVRVLRQHLSITSPLVPRDDWERNLFGAAIDCGVSLSDAAVSSDGLYD